MFGNDGSHLGHCCSEHPPSGGTSNITVCAVGNVHPTGKCPDRSQPVDAEIDPKFLPLCPMMTHTCQNYVCCPLPCRRPISGYFSVDNTCYDNVVLGTECNVDAQCITFAECKQSSGQSITVKNFHDVSICK